MVWILYTGSACGFIAGFFAAWVGKTKVATQYAIIDGDKVLLGQLEKETRCRLIAEARIEKAQRALADFPKEMESQ